VLRDVRIRRTRAFPTTEWHRTPWVAQWTMHVVEIPDERAETVAACLAETIDATRGAWYAGFKSDATHYVVFSGRIFRVSRAHPEEYEAPRAHGRALGIAERQLDFDTYDVDAI
jgi:hypothetical protein